MLLVRDKDVSEVEAEEAYAAESGLNELESIEEAIVEADGFAEGGEVVTAAMVAGPDPGPPSWLISGMTRSEKTDATLGAALGTDTGAGCCIFIAIPNPIPDPTVCWGVDGGMCGGICDGICGGICGGICDGI